MPASIDDKITRVRDTEDPVVTTVVSDRAPHADTLACDNLDGWPEDTAVHFATLKVDAGGKVVPGSQINWKGIVNRSASTILSLIRVGGAEDNGNDVNDEVKLGPTPSWADDLAQALMTSMNTDGTLKPVGALKSIEATTVKLSVAETQPSPDSNAIILWFEPL